jgi:hypothetical protein
MKLTNFIKGIFVKKKKIDVKILPSQGLFYRDDFKISIKKVDKKEIIEYETEYDREDLGLVLRRLKKIVESNTILPKEYTFKHIKSIDVIFIFLEIVKFTNNKPIQLEYFNDEIGMIDKINFDENNFNYCRLDEEIMENWDSKERCFVINGYKFSLPSIGIENSLTNFLIKKSYEEDSNKYNEYNYNFTYFLGDKEFINFDEIENLIQIFNFDMESDEFQKTEDLVKLFIPLQRYSLIKNNKVIEMSSKINLQEIWK